MNRLLDTASETRYGALVHVAVMTGLRQGELLGLRWRDADLGAGVLCVRQTLQWLPKRGAVFGQPKTHRSSRPVALPRVTVEALAEHRRQQLEDRLAAGPAYEDNGLVFATAVGKPIQLTPLRNAWKRITQKAVQGHLRFHDLRHAHASLLLRQGVHPKIVSERLGHADIALTLNTYSHVLPNLQAEAADRRADLVANG